MRLQYDDFLSILYHTATDWRQKDMFSIQMDKAMKYFIGHSSSQIGCLLTHIATVELGLCLLIMATVEWGIWLQGEEEEEDEDIAEEREMELAAAEGRGDNSCNISASHMNTATSGDSDTALIYKWAVIKLTVPPSNSLVIELPQVLD